MSMAHCTIFGAGKIARGFIGQLLFLSGHSTTYIEKNQALVDLLSERKSYFVNILGAPDKSCTVTEFSAVQSDDIAVSQTIEQTDVIFTAMGGKNLEFAAPALYEGIKKRFTKSAPRELTIITCENWKNPATVLRNAIYALANNDEQAVFDQYLGITESVIMRSAIEAEKEDLEKDPLVVNVQNFWDLPVDKTRVKGELPSILAMRLIDNFGGFLDKKFYTYNAANGTASFLGSLLGYKYISDAARDSYILEILSGVYQETATALSKRLGLSMDDLVAFDKTSLHKLQDTCIVDYTERNARDPIRKLGPDDRLVGPARMCMDYGVMPHYLATAIAAAIHYTNPDDQSAVELSEILAAHGTRHVLTNVCKLDKASPLIKLVLEKEQVLLQKGLIKV